jgi:hypothetical protein
MGSVARSAIRVAVPAYSQRGFEAKLSTEQLSLLNTDVIVLIADRSSPLAASRLFRQLRAVHGGRVVTLAGDGASGGALGYDSPLSRPYLLKRIVPGLAAAVDGDPATRVPPDRDELSRARLHADMRSSMDSLCSNVGGGARTQDESSRRDSGRQLLLRPVEANRCEAQCVGLILRRA